ncbi:hypothetical protein [Enterobacter sp.]|uniref:hypothetical protein n=1 Tax=Enterobacter sp. TaxID=42895 RepID=UPI00296F794F|nr:hypothetical protein [Enterobacter sp.]
MIFRTGMVAALALTLTGCVVADLDSSNFRHPPYAHTIQKPGQLGHTDVAQRTKDLYSCGLDKNIAPDDFSRNQLRPGETSEEHTKRIGKLESCMQSKGYILQDFDKCGPLKAPTGKCN